MSSSYSLSRWLTLTCRRTLNWYKGSSSSDSSEDEPSEEPLDSDSADLALATILWVAWESMMIFEKLMSTYSSRFLRNSSLAFFFTFLSYVMRNFWRLVISLFCKTDSNSNKKVQIDGFDKSNSGAVSNWSENLFKKWQNSKWYYDDIMSLRGNELNESVRNVDEKVKGSK